MAALDYRQELSWSRYSPIDNTGRKRSPFKSGYKNIRFFLTLQSVRTLTATDVANLPGLSEELYGSVDLWRILLAYNGLNNPLQDVYVGLELKIPTKTSVIAWLTQQQDSNRKALVI